MRFIALIPPMIAVSLGGIGRPVSADVLIRVNKDRQQMAVAVDGQVRHTWPVSTGGDGYDTPGGSYRPLRMEKSHFSREWDNAPMPNAIFFTSTGHAIHGTTHGRSLGRAVSHGCVRLSLRNASTLFGLVKAQGMGNTRVVVEGSDGRVAISRRSAVRSASARRSYEGYGEMSAGAQMGLENGSYYRPVRSRQPFYEPAPTYGYGYGYD